MSAGDEQTASKELILRMPLSMGRSVVVRMAPTVRNVGNKHFVVATTRTTHRASLSRQSCSAVAERIITH